MKAKKFFRASHGLIAAARLSTGSDQLLGPGITQVLATPLLLAARAGLVFGSGDYFVQRFRRCGDNSRAAFDRAKTVISRFTSANPDKLRSGYVARTFLA